MKKGTKKATPNKRTTHQFDLHQNEFDSIYELAGLPKQVSKGAALREQLIKHKDLIVQYSNLVQHLKQLSAKEAATS